MDAPAPPPAEGREARSETPSPLAGEGRDRGFFSRRRLPAALGAAAGVLLLASLFFPYWQARLFAPQYRHGLRATMYAYKLAGDIDEIDNLNHYVGVTKLGNLAVIERKIAVPSAVLLALLCAFLPWMKRPSWRWTGALGVAAYPAGFVADMAYWMNHAATHLDPMAPLKLKPFSIPVIGTGKVGQFRSEVGPMPGFFVALAAVALLWLALWLLKEKKTALKQLAAALLFLSPLAAPAAGSRADDLQSLIAAAPEGGVLRLPDGVFNGPVVIDKALTLRGSGRTVIDGGGNGTVVTVRAAGAALENLTVRNSGESMTMEDSGVRVEAGRTAVRGCFIDDVLFGVFLVEAPDAALEDNRIRGKDLDVARRGDLIRLWYSDRAVLRGNRLERGRDAVLWFSNGSVMEDNDVRGGRYGLHFMYTNDCRVAGNTFSDNSVGAYIMYSKNVSLENNRFENNRGPSGAGLGLKESDSITVEKNIFRNNRRGLFIDQSPILPENVNRFTGNLFAHNDAGIAILPGAKGDVFAGNTFQDNLQQVSVKGGGALDHTLWHENGRGNFWSDYAGYGAAGAPVGKLPYRVESAFENLIDKHPAARFFLFTPASQALEMAARAFPLFKPKARLTDPFPLLTPPFQDKTEKRPLQSAALVAPVGLMSLAGMILGFFHRKRHPSPVPSGHPLPLAGEGQERGSLPPSEGEGADGGVFIVEAINVDKSFGGRRILRDFTFRMEAGESVILWGANGAGKSTFLKSLIGLSPFEGSITLFGRDIRRAGDRARRKVGYLAQEFAGYDWTVRQAMEFICRLRGLDAAKISPTLAACGLPGEESKAVPALSGGMKQKLALAQALIADPDLLVLDEPCANLDLASRREFMEILRRLKGARSLLLTSHRLEEVEALADRVVWLAEGAAPKDLAPLEFFAALGRRFPLWVRLEDEAANGRAMGLLRREGFEVSPNGHGLWVKAEPGRKMEIARGLERAGIPVRDIREEEGL